MDQTELTKTLESIPADRHAKVTCALIGHSRVQTTCFGYWSCARCDDQIGDSLGSLYKAAEKAVALDHYCDVCRDNAATLSWTDTFGLKSEALEYIDILRDPVRYATAKDTALKVQENAKKALAALRDNHR